MDPRLLIRAERFEEFDRDLRRLFAEAGVEPLAWWPERINTDTFHNYAVIFYHQHVLLQYDINIQAWSGGKVRVRPSAIIFDKKGILEPAEGDAPPGFRPGRLTWTAECYWIYVYIHGKYLLRGDPFRLAAAQQELLTLHLHILHALSPSQPLDWWPLLAQSVTDDSTRSAVLTYLGRSDAEVVADSLPLQTELFARDARDACQKWGEHYPEALEEAVTRELQGILKLLRHSLSDPVKASRNDFQDRAFQKTRPE